MIDKPYDMGSTKVVAVLKRFLHPIKIGHAGTLDPLATGVLPVALGKATRLIPYIMNGKKTYQFTIKWGVETDSDDLGGKEIATNDKRPTATEINDIIPKFIGNIEQTPNVFSAIKVDGKRAYDLARSGQPVVITPRQITIYDLRSLDASSENATFEVICSKGTYVRTLAHDIAHALETVGVVTMLRRTACDPFDIGQTISLDDIKNEKITADTLPLIPMESVVKNLPTLELSATEIKRLSQGQRLSVFKLETSNSNILDGTYCIKTNNKIAGLVKKDENVIHPEFIWLDIQ